MHEADRDYLPWKEKEMVPDVWIDEKVSAWKWRHWSEKVSTGD
jgi:hypothetical protein